MARKARLWIPHQVRDDKGSKFRPLCWGLAGIAIVACLVYVLKYMGYGVMYQPTISMPKGFYLIIPPHHLHRGDTVIFHPPRFATRFLSQHHLAPDNGLLLKTILGIPGDYVCRHNNMVYMEHHAALPVYRYYAPNKLLPSRPFCSTLQPQQYFLASTHIARSYDSRYFGPIDRVHIVGKAVRL